MGNMNLILFEIVTREEVSTTIEIPLAAVVFLMFLALMSSG